MCFSAAADFAAAGVIGAVGIATLAGRLRAAHVSPDPTPGLLVSIRDALLA